MNFNFIADITTAKQSPSAQAKQNTVNKFDSAAADAAQSVLSLDDQAFNSEILSLRRDAIYGAFQLADDIIEDDLEDGELPSDRLDAYLLGDLNPDASDEEQQLSEQIIQIKAANMADAFASLGVDDETIAAAFNDDDVNAADEATVSIAEIILANLPAPEDMDDFIQTFIFGEGPLDMGEGQVNEFDTTQVGKTKVRKTKHGQTLVYRGVKAVRAGKITIVNKRVGNTSMKVKLSSAQKQALRKASAKAVTPNAIKRRLKSLRIGQRQGIYKQNKTL
jgi:sulfur carrier protein ThiS